MGLTWSDLFTAGSMFNLHTGAWDRMATIKPTDLGVPDTDEVRQALTRLSMRLLPDEYIKPLRNIINGAKMKLESKTAYFPLIRGARFVPTSSREELENDLSAMRENLKRTVEDLIENYEKAKREQYPILVKAIQTTAKTPESAQLLIARIPEFYPSSQSLRERFYIRWQVFSLSAPIDGAVGTDIEKEATDVKDALRRMLERLRKDLDKRVGEISDLVMNGGKITKRTYNSTTRLCDRIDSITKTLADPALIRASKALRSTVDAAGGIEDDSKARDLVLKDGLKEVALELQASVEAGMRAVEERLTGFGRRRLAV